MIVNFFVAEQKKGYLSSKNHTGVYYPFFPSANVAYRRETFEEVLGYDEDLITGEDLDLCIRLHKKHKTLFFQSSAIVYHRHRKKLKDLLSQFYGYGFFQPEVYLKHIGERALYIYRYKVFKKNELTMGAMKLSLKLPFPFLVSITWNLWIPFVTFFILGWYFIFATSFPYVCLFFFSLCAYLYFLLMYRWIGRGHLWLRLQMIFTQTLTDWAFIIGALRGGIHKKCIYVNHLIRTNDKVEVNFDAAIMDELKKYKISNDY